ncbi:hypothetical protein CYMTET_10309 [Cymbomonas tetramitiformis]|uniref:HD domain-containing protein n=1 Tax=Cymbomonas tetramitiformis TaxID=36881 RepID=A0AAE0LEL2_9CHLO|nr:hypothetical protein CYMTET_10309 [Cymbomonas tetramitiformis]
MFARAVAAFSHRVLQTSRRKSLSTHQYLSAAAIQYRSLKEATPEEWKVGIQQFNKVASSSQQAIRMLDMLRVQKGTNIGALVDLYEHGLQTATRAYRDGANEETIVVALLHDVGELITPISHGEIAGSILRPYISQQNYWILMHHEIFQAYYYGDAAGATVDKNARDDFKDHEFYEECIKFCEKWDQAAFDPEYDTLPLEFFEPMVHRVLARRPYTDPELLNDPINVAKSKIAGGYPEAN